MRRCGLRSLELFLCKADPSIIFILIVQVYPPGDWHTNGALRDMKYIELKDLRVDLMGNNHLSFP
jgi:hypothetical protein